MNNQTIRRGGILILILLLLAPMPFMHALAEANVATGSAVVQSKLNDAPVVDLGVIPDETETEKDCSVLLVADAATGVLIHEKNIDIQMPISGSAVQLMSALTILDYVFADEVITVSKDQMKVVPHAGKKFGLAEKSSVYAADLIASMLLINAVDSAVVLTDIVQSKAGVESFGALMAEKARQLGMESTDYTTCSGWGTDELLTTARDQSKLYMEALDHDTLGPILKSGTYQVRSKISFFTPTPVVTMASAPSAATTSAPKPATTPIPSRAPKGKDGNEGVVDLNAALPLELTNSISAVVPNNRNYDVRLSSAISCSASYAQKHYGIAYYRATDYRSDIIVIFWSQASARRISLDTLGDLTEIFSRRKVMDLVPYIQMAASSLTIEKSGLSVSGWMLADEYKLFGRQMNAYDPTAREPEKTATTFDPAELSVRLQPNANTMVTKDDGSRTVSALVLVNNEVAGTVLLSTASKAGSVDTAKQKPMDLYTDDDIMPTQPTLMSQYGWVILIAGTALVAMIVIILGVLIRNRME